jgi:hypothetical protein
MGLMPTVKKIATLEKQKRGRKPKQIMFIFICPEGCTLKSISRNIEAFCGVHDGIAMELKEKK